MTDHLGRAFAFLRRGDVHGTSERPFRYGTAVFTPELPLRYDSNLLYVDRLEPDTSAAELEAEAERVFGDAGLAHRALLFRDAAAGERLAPDFSGWDVDRHIIMAQLRRPDQPIETTGVVEVGSDALRAARRAQIESYPWGRPEVATQLLDAKHLLSGWVDVRCFAVMVGGAVVSYADLYTSDGDAQIEDVGTLEEHRGRGYAKAVVTRAADEARAAGAEFVFLVADGQDWPKELYARLGFDVVGRYVKLLKRPPL